MPSLQDTFQARLGSRQCWSGELGLTQVLPPVTRHSEILDNSNLIRSQRKPLDSRDAKRGLPGLIAWLPLASEIPHLSVIRASSDVNEGAFNHPVTILAQDPHDHELVFCAQVTSFGGRSIREKYYNVGTHPVYWSYLPIRHPKRPGENINGLGSLSTSKMMPKPSYLNLNYGFWIEWRYLQQFSHARLSGDSHHLATWAYSVAEEHRREHGDDSKVKLARKVTPPSHATTFQAQPTAPHPESLREHQAQAQLLEWYHQQLPTPPRTPSPPYWTAPPQYNMEAATFAMASGETGYYDPASMGYYVSQQAYGTPADSQSLNFYGEPSVMMTPNPTYVDGGCTFFYT